MKLLFVYSSFTLGGIETFILRLTKELHKENDISVLFFSDKHSFNKELFEELSSYAKIYFWNDFITIPEFLKTKHPLFRLQFKISNHELFQNLISEADYIHAPDTYSLLFALKIAKTANKKIFISTGVYHINEYLIQDFKKYYFGKKILQMLSNIGAGNILFFNEISREEYSKKIKPAFNDSLVAPIGVDLTDYKDLVLGKKNNRIVSIGRLTSWKTYNFSMIEVIYELKKRGYQFFYYSFGDGDKLEEINGLVKKYELEDQVFFNKSVNYNLFKETIANHLLFIGAGTALIEASAAGVPALIGIENCNEATTYGFLQDTDTYSYQELQLHYEKKKIIDCILKLYESTDSEYSQICQDSKIRANDFDIKKTKELFLKMLENNQIWQQDFKINNTLFFISLLLNFFFSRVIKITKRNFFDRL